MLFEWDPQKAMQNIRKHDVSFEEATSVFGDPLSVTVADPDHSVNENRFLIIGVADTGRVLIVSHTDRTNIVRIISARELTPRERKAYERGNF